MRPPSIVLFERLWIAAILLGAVNMAVAWNPTLAAYRRTGAFAELRVDPRLALAMIDLVSLLLPLGVLLLVGRGRSRIGRWMALLLGLWALVVIGRMATERGAVRGTRGMLASICILLQVAGASMLLRADARDWLGRRRRQ